MTAALLPDLQEASARLEEFLSGFLHRNAERYAYGALFEPLYDDLAEHLLHRGKRLRPLLFLGTYRLCGGARPWNDPGLLSAAAALELLHSFILIHDDVIDRAERRRGRPTLHRRMAERLGRLPGADRLGENLAVVLGDMLHALAVDTLLEADFPAPVREAALRRFLQYAGDTGGGEALDILLSTQDIARVTPEEIERMYHLKTTRYTFEAPLLLGALLAGAPAETAEALAASAELLGLAFQIRNDLEEYAHFDLLDPALQTDLLEGKKTLLLRAAYEGLGETDRSFLQLCLDAPGSRGVSLRKIRELIEKSGAAATLERRQEELLARAQAGPAPCGEVVSLARRILRG
ncbi:MAG: polyprenyl synthetase family protein [Verrucomicrobium sp.]|nr:polyprenyl synthetase family protein [Verrucomicrobium sp.]